MFRLIKWQPKMKIIRISLHYSRPSDSHNDNKYHIHTNSKPPPFHDYVTKKCVHRPTNQHNARAFAETRAIEPAPPRRRRRDDHHHSSFVCRRRSVCECGVRERCARCGVHVDIEIFQSVFVTIIIRKTYLCLSSQRVCGIVSPSSTTVFPTTFHSG